MTTISIRLPQGLGAELEDRRIIEGYESTSSLVRDLLRSSLKESDLRDELFDLKESLRNIFGALVPMVARSNPDLDASTNLVQWVDEVFGASPDELDDESEGD